MKNKLSIFFAMVLLAATGAANAALIDFEVDDVGTCYSATCTNVQGFDFTFVAGGWAVNDDGNSYFNRNGKLATEGLAGGHGVGNGAPPLTITMSMFGGGTFSLGSLDAASGFSGFAGSTSIEVVGSLFNGGTVSQTLTATNAWSSYVLNGFSDLTQLTFSNADAVAGISIDNLNTELSQIPEPSTLALLGLSLAGLGFARRKKF